MCGIAAVKGYKAEEKVIGALNKIIHRGSSNHEFSSGKDYSLGANRLPIVDREHGKQPLTNPGKSLIAIQNGEIFNHHELRTELIKKGHTFKTATDTEVLIHLYEEYGVEMIDYLDSEMFAFVIYDVEKEIFFVARDRLGVKPLFYAYDNDGAIHFVSELKQLSERQDIDQIYNFPKGHYYHDGEFTPYFSLVTKGDLSELDESVNLLSNKIAESVRKRVQTDLPIAVLLSGGVDSSLIMELACRFHSDVTAIILGSPGSLDYEYALKLCHNRGYKYHIVRPQVDYKEELDSLIYYLETFEPNIIHQSFSLNICMQEAEKLGITVILAGDGADELFAGYNEFSSLSKEEINKGCVLLTDSLDAGHLQRVDRLSMRYTREIRQPFFDTEVVELAMRISGALKVDRTNHQLNTKYVLRKVAEQFLPEYIAWRYKVPFSNGAGMNVGNNYKAEDGDVAKVVLEKDDLELSQELTKKYRIETTIEKYYLNKFMSFGYHKRKDSHKRIVVKDNLSSICRSNLQRLVVAEFDRLALFFPLYYANENNFFSNHGIEVDYVATGGDRETYMSLENNSAHIGLADPMFTMFDKAGKPPGKIINELVSAAAPVAVTINPNVEINSEQDFAKYKIGTFPKLTTTHALTKMLVGDKAKIFSFQPQQVVQALIDRKVDVAIVLPEQVSGLETLGFRQLYDFSEHYTNFLFSGFMISNLLTDEHKESVEGFSLAMREAIRELRKNEQYAREEFKKYFPTIKKHDDLFSHYLKLWTRNLDTIEQNKKSSFKMWRSLYPNLLKKYESNFSVDVSPAEKYIKLLTKKKFRRDHPFLEDKMDDYITNALSKGEPLHFFAMWGAGKKTDIDEIDVNMITWQKQYFSELEATFPNGIEVHWILTDTHAIFNGFEENGVNSYLNKVEISLEEKGFSEIIRLSSLWEKHGHSNEKIIKFLESQPADWWSNVSTAALIEKQAKNIFGEENYLVKAQRYYSMRASEKQLLTEEFKIGIHMSFEDVYTQSVLPSIPTLYVYTFSSGVSERPWLLSS